MKVHLHPDIQAFRGRFVDSVYQVANGGAQVKRALVKPVNPNSAYQQSIRDDFALLAANWASVPATSVNKWGALGQRYTRTDANGNSRPLTDIEAHNMVNMFRLMDNQALTTSPGSDTALPTGVSVTTAIYDSGLGQVVIECVEPDTVAKLYRVRLTPPTPAPYVLRRGKCRLISTDPADAIISATGAGGSVTLTIAAADLKPTGDPVSPIDWTNMDRVGIEVLTLDSNYRPEQGYGAFDEITVAVM